MDVRSRLFRPWLLNYRIQTMRLDREIKYIVEESSISEALDMLVELNKVNLGRYMYYLCHTRTVNPRCSTDVWPPSRLHSNHVERGRIFFCELG